MDCWEYNSCGRERGGINTADLGECPAHPLHGRHCAKIVGTLCGGEVQGTLAMKIETCEECRFYNCPYYDKNYNR